MSVYQPAPGQNSTTVMPGCNPKKVRVSTGWRKASRALSCGRRQSPATAAARLSAPLFFGALALGAGSGTFFSGVLGPQAASAAQAPPARNRRREAPDETGYIDSSDKAAPAPPRAA